VKLLYVCADPGIPLDGHKGASVHVRQTVEALRSRGVEVRVLATRPGTGIKVPVIDVGAVELPHGRCGRVERETALLGLSSMLVAAASHADFKPDIVYERYSLWSLTGCALAERMNLPLVLEVNAPLVEEQRRYRDLAMEPLARELERIVLGRADRVLCVSPALVERAVSLTGDHERTLWMPNAVDTERFRPPEVRERRTVPTVVFVGSLKPWHGLDLLIDAFRLLRRGGTAARLLVIGDGPMRERLERLVRDAALQADVVLLGTAPHDVVPTLLAEADVAVAPYPPIDDFYFSPLKLGEYLACGLPVVASDIPGLVDGLRSGGCLTTFPPGNARALAARLRVLLEDEALRQRMGEAARRTAEERLSLAPATDLLLEVLREAVERRRALPLPRRGVS